jgi:hypothetical protein
MKLVRIWSLIIALGLSLSSISAATGRFRRHHCAGHHNQQTELATVQTVHGRGYAGVLGGHLSLEVP